MKTHLSCIIALLLGTVSGLYGQQSSATVTVRIGSVDGPDALGRVEAIQVDTTGRIFVLESDMHRVQVYSARGEWLATIGRRGSGPGEFMNPAGMTWGPEGRLWVIDPGNSRASIFDLDGTPAGEKRLEAGFELAPWPGRFDRSGRLYHYATDPRLEEFEYVMVAYDASMHPLDTIIPPAPPERPQYFETRTDRWGTVRAAVPFAPKTVWRLASDGEIWWAWTSRYEIFRGPDARHPIIARAMAPVPVTDDQRASALDGLKRFRAMGGRVDESRIPRTRSALQGFFLDDDDRIWTLLTTDGTNRLLEVFTPDGTFLSRFQLPVHLLSSPQPVVRGNVLYGLVLGDFDEPYVVGLLVPL